MVDQRMLPLACYQQRRCFDPGGVLGHGEGAGIAVGRDEAAQRELLERLSIAIDVPFGNLERAGVEPGPERRLE